MGCRGPRILIATCGIRGGELYCWGEGSGPRPALDSSGSASEPVRVGGLTNWKQVALGSYHGCGLLEDGALYCWGDKDLMGFNADSEPARIPDPTLVDGASTWVHLSTGDNHTCGLQGDGSVWCWGSNVSGELGVGPSWSTTPVPVSMD